MRIAIAGLSLESVSFLHVPTTLEDFRRTESAGPAMLTRFRGTNTVMGGFIKVLEAEGAEIVPLVTAEGGAAGPATDEAFTHYIDRICAELAEAGPLDGVLLHPHGAMTTTTRLDPDREFIERVRGTVGRATRLVVALDYHGNIDESWIPLVDGLFGYHYSPHTDTGTTGERAATCLIRTLRGEIRPVVAIAKPGVMVPSIFSATDIAPCRTSCATAWRCPPTPPACSMSPSSPASPMPTCPTAASPWSPWRMATKSSPRPPPSCSAPASAASARP